MVDESTISHVMCIYNHEWEELGFEGGGRKFIPAEMRDGSEWQ